MQTSTTAGLLDRVMPDFESAASWSVNYHGMPYDDARKVDGGWWYRSQVGDREILRFLWQDRVVPLFENPTVFIVNNGVAREYPNGRV